jgi:hypothetical protein
MVTSISRHRYLVVASLGKDCLAGVLIAREFRKSVIENAGKFNIALLKFNLVASNWYTVRLLIWSKVFNIRGYDI